MEEEEEVVEEVEDEERKREEEAVGKVVVKGGEDVEREERKKNGVSRSIHDAYGQNAWETVESSTFQKGWICRIYSTFCAFVFGGAGGGEVRVFQPSVQE